MKNRRTGNCLLLLLSLICLSACDKQGPMGPPGNPGPDGANGAGGNILTYQTDQSSNIEWDPVDGWQGDGVYILKLNDKLFIDLPDSAAAHFTNGGVIVVSVQDAATNLWHQVPYMPQEREFYSYYLHTVSDGTAIQISATVDNNLLPVDIKTIKISIASASEKNMMALQ